MDEHAIRRNRLERAQEAFAVREQQQQRHEQNDEKDESAKTMALLGPINRSSVIASTKKKRAKPGKLTSFNANSSMASISELQPVLEFDESQCSNISSLSQLTISNGSLQLSFSNCVTQGPSLFETDSQEKIHTSAPRLPKRRTTSISSIDFDGEGSDSSLSLEDIMEESCHSTSSHTTTAITEAPTVTTTSATGSVDHRWSEPTTPKGEETGVQMPIRSESYRFKAGSSFSSQKSFQSDSTLAEENLSASSLMSNSTTSFNNESSSSLQGSGEFQALKDA
jgi:hypothetical protein